MGQFEAPLLRLKSAPPPRRPRPSGGSRGPGTGASAARRCGRRSRSACESAAGHLRNTYKRTHRWDKVLRDQDDLALVGKEASMVNVLFSTIPDDLGLYGKPMARNVQLWTLSPELLLDGPRA